MVGTSFVIDSIEFPSSYLSQSNSLVVPCIIHQLRNFHLYSLEKSEDTSFDKLLGEYNDHVGDQAKCTVKLSDLMGETDEYARVGIQSCKF